MSDVAAGEEETAGSASLEGSFWSLEGSSVNRSPTKLGKEHDPSIRALNAMTASRNRAFIREEGKPRSLGVESSLAAILAGKS